MPAERQWWNLSVDLRLKPQVHAGESGAENISQVYARVEVWFQSMHTETNDALYYELKGRAQRLSESLGAVELIDYEYEPADGPYNEDDYESDPTPQAPSQEAHGLDL